MDVLRGRRREVGAVLLFVEGEGGLEVSRGRVVSSWSSLYRRRGRLAVWYLSPLSKFVVATNVSAIVVWDEVVEVFVIVLALALFRFLS